MWKSNWNRFSFGIALTQIFVTLFFFSQLPDQVPMHWGIGGEVDRYGSKGEFLALSFLPIGVFFLIHLLPKLDPRKQSYQQHKKAYTITNAAVVIFLAVINFLVLSDILGWNIPLLPTMFVLLTILFLVIGNYLTQARPNFFFGIRTPWTLSSSEVWRKTHRMAGYLYIPCALLFLLPIWLKVAWVHFIPIIGIIALMIFLYLYSYLLYQKERGK
ncbi:SdpI family protein [Risungbinella massiliensis]|uniref:SdpI family protein n=1 Tax=Risungbinella massiliensis TaxID=1329796 RepID=UPI00069A5A43|nr:SdpI family protein [Risungbinella massiliensis]